MEKLIKLLNEYEEELNTGLHWRIDEEYGMLWRGLNLMGVDQYLISKHYGLIKWLVENDKIDRNLVDGAILHKTHRLFEDDYGVENMNKQYYEKTLMLLAIQDEPIRFLCEILK